MTIHPFNDIRRKMIGMALTPPQTLPFPMLPSSGLLPPTNGRLSHPHHQPRFSKCQSTASFALTSLLNDSLAGNLNLTPILARRLASLNHRTPVSTSSFTHP